MKPRVTFLPASFSFSFILLLLLFTYLYFFNNEHKLFKWKFNKDAIGTHTKKAFDTIIPIRGYYSKKIIQNTKENIVYKN